MQRLHKMPVVMSRSLVLLTMLAGMLWSIPGSGTHAASAAGTLPANWIKGVNMIGYSPDPYKIANLHDAIASWAATGANSIALAPRWFMDAPSSTAIVADPNLGSPSDESVIAAIDESHRQGLRVMLRPYLDVKDGSWRAEITPSNVATWFASYQAFMDHYLDMAKAHGVEEFTIGVELINMTQPKYDSNWSALITDARSRFPGLLTYSANWGKDGQSVEFTQIDWWGKLDYIGISAYFPLNEGDSPSVEQMVAGWTTYTDHWGGTYHWIDDLKAVHDRFGKDVAFTETGFGSYINSPARWDQPQKTNVLDLGVQARAIDATFQALGGLSWFRGIYWWHWEPYVGGGGANDTSDALNNKPAVQVLTQWFGGNSQPPTQATPAPPVPVTPVPAPQPPSQARPAPQPGQAGVNNPAFDRVASPGPDTDTRVYFDATGHTLQGVFYQYWKSHGGLWLFGYPLSEEYQEISATDGKPYTVQYFERERFEYHPEYAGTPNEVLLGLLGTYMVKGRTGSAFDRIAPFKSNTSKLYFDQTGHSIGGTFRSYWEQYGGLPIFGYPLSEEFQEVSTTDGKTYTVQYFERARFESHPEYAGTPNEVLLGLLGHWYTGR